MKTTITAITSLTAILACLTLSAQESPKPAAGSSLAERFKQLDKNGDGKLTAEEVPYGDFFKHWDQNSDGVVTLEEVKAFFASGKQRQRSSAQNPAALQAGNVPMKTVLDLPYAKIEGVEPKLMSLDLYAPPSATNAPILVWVHGGGWARGDKGQVASLPAAFVREGFVVASVNYRLAPAVKFDAQAQDVAAAIAWMRKHAKDYGAAPEKMFLMGHSAGAHLVALVGTDEIYLKAHSISLSALRGVVPLDTEAYDLKVFAARFGGKLPELYAAPFTQDSATWAKASPATHVAKDKSIPPMIVAYSGGQKPHGNPSRKTDAEEFVGKLKAAGITAEVIAAPEKTHMQIALEFGTPNDQVAAKVFAFLKTILGVSAAPPSSADFTPDDVRMGDAQFAYIDPEFLQSEGRTVFLDSSLNIWVGEIDPATGLFRSASGRDQRVDTGISQWSRYSNGPEWGLDAKGPALFYVKDNAQGAGQLWRAEPPWDKPRLAQLTHDTDIHNWICEPSVNAALPSTRVIVYHGKPRASDNVDAWLDEDKPDQPKPFTDRMIVARWAYNTNLITFAYRARAGQTEPSQVTLVDTDTGKSRIITADEGNKVDPWLWQAPEFGGEAFLCANVDSRALAIYRDVKHDGSPWQRIATFRLPADAPHQTLKSVEPINGGRGAFGRSYFIVQAGDDKDKDTSIWLFGFSPDGQHLIRRLDDGAQTGKPARRLDPESYIGEHELFVYYNLVGDGPSQLHRCRTAITP
ncbi:MAG: alpha/beta hydrolase fold domain-containing protein [Verrucomicrobia bacterium]|nr:alpha/beta hydrolase fold domain-containing protein [Verrucomicrobiota bacterium]